VHAGDVLATHLLEPTASSCTTCSGLVQTIHQFRTLSPCAAGVQDRGVSPLRRGAAATLQLNIGLYCNQARCAQTLPASNLCCEELCHEELCYSLQTKRGSMQHPQLYLQHQQLQGGVRQLPCESFYLRQPTARRRACRRAATATWRARRCARRPWTARRRCGAWSWRRMPWSGAACARWTSPAARPSSARSSGQDLRVSAAVDFDVWAWPIDVRAQPAVLVSILLSLLVCPRQLSRRILTPRCP
jgi:hypothetical protein